MSKTSETPHSRLSKREAELEALAEAIEHSSHLLPAQGPITVFIHHNTLHAFEELPFAEAVKQASQVFGCHPYLSEDQYREALRRGRIRFEELRQVLHRDLGDSAEDPVPCFGTRLELRLEMLQDPLRTGPSEELVWFVAEANALKRVRPEVSAAVRAKLIAETRRWVMRDVRGQAEFNGKRAGATSPAGALQSIKELLERFGEATIENWSDDDWEGFTLQAMWRACCDGVRNVPPFAPMPPLPIRHRDLLLEATGEDPDLLVHNLLIRFVGAFLDQGLASIELPLRDEGFYRSFRALYSQPAGPPNRWMRGLSEELRRQEEHRTSPLESVLESLDLLGVQADERQAYISSTLLALRGWGGMVHQIELRGDRVVRPAPKGSLVEFLAVRLILDRFAAAYIARTAMDYDGALSELRKAAFARADRYSPPGVEQRAFLVFQLAQVAGLPPGLLYDLEKEEWTAILREIETFSALERRRIFHLAYERRFNVQSLDAVAIHSRQRWGRPKSPAIQVVCCLDEREESFRRHFEELAPGVETFGAAGFFSVAMYYRGAADAHFTPLCPVVVRPQQWVVEDVEEDHAATHLRRAMTRRYLGSASHRVHLGSRTIGSGTLLSGAGVLASFPLLARILFPRAAARIRQALGRIVDPPGSTRLHLERAESVSGPENGHVGFTVDEMTTAAERLLRDMGLTSGFARLVLILGHGSNSLNNPYNSAYNCGACGGSAGGPNARAMAQILNDPRVRDNLASRGLSIPDETCFVGGWHNTCNETVTFFDLHRIPSTHRDEFESVGKLVEGVCERNAHERCRRFMSAPLTLSYREAREHVEERSEDLAQTRPELGHATNALVVVGRREWTRGLYLDRRAFLTSYDPTQDDENCSILVRILQAVFPVCAGINLEYFFSRVDNSGFGSGTKLPHNLASLLGVMDGAASDLRTGLPWQMVEIHEPVRSLFIIETTPESMLAIMERDAGIGRLCRNGWVQLAVVDPQTRRISLFQDGAFEPYEPEAATLPRAASSIDWYRGWRDHLEFCQIESDGPLTNRTAPGAAASARS